MICSFNFLIFLAVCLNISTVINIKILTDSNQQTPSYKFTSHIAAFLSVVLITEMFEICIQTSYDQNVQLILKSYLPVVYGTPFNSSRCGTLALYCLHFILPYIKKKVRARIPQLSTVLALNVTFLPHFHMIFMYCLTCSCSLFLTQGWSGSDYSSLIMMRNPQLISCEFPTMILVLYENLPLDMLIN